MLTLHKPEHVFSLRHAPSWLMLCFSAGCVNAVSLLACGRFVTHVTGTVTRLGVELSNLTLMLDFALVLACFIAGAMAAGVMLQGPAARGMVPLFSLPLWITACTIAGVAVAGHLGYLGPFGGTVDELADFVHLSVLSFAMGLQNAAVASSTGQLVRTTHLTGPATDLGIHFAELLFAEGEARKLSKRHALLRAGKIAAYIAGAALAVPAARALGYLALLVPAAVVASATLLSFASRVPAPQSMASQQS